MLKFKCADLECNQETTISDLMQPFDFRCPMCGNSKIIFNQDVKLECIYKDGEVLDCKSGEVIRTKKEARMIHTPQGSYKSMCMSRETGDMTKWYMTLVKHDPDYVKGKIPVKKSVEKDEDNELTLKTKR